MYVTNSGKPANNPDTGARSPARIRLIGDAPDSSIYKTIYKLNKDKFIEEFTNPIDDRSRKGQGGVTAKCCI